MEDPEAEGEDQEEANEVEEAREVAEEDEAATELTGLGEELEGGREIHEEETKGKAKKLVVQAENRVTSSNQQTKTTQSLHLHLGLTNGF